jgi:SAM-dependent methyltransferase
MSRWEDVAVDRADIRRLWEANAPAWIELSRAGFDVYRDLVNTPAFFELLPGVDRLFGLDVGCGEGHNTRLLADRGATVIAVDVSVAFIEAAASEHRPGIAFVVGDGADLPFRGSALDFVTAFMSLMDVGDPERVLQEVARVLKPGGFVQVSVVHPATSTSVRHWIDDEFGQRHALAVGDYFYEGPLTERWIFGAAPPEVRDRHEPFTITYARRTLAGWINAILEAGFVLEAIAEPHADEQTARAHPEVADTRIAPYFLILRARKPTDHHLHQTRRG